MWWPTHARSPLGQAERVLQLGAAGEQRRRRAAGQRQARGHVTARAAQRTRCARVRRHRRRRTTESSVRVWIGRSWSRNRSASAAEPLERVVVAVGDRLVGDVPARHHERRAGVGEQQVMQRRVRAASRRARAHPGATEAATGAPGRARREHDRPLRPATAARAPLRPASPERPAASTDAAISANGLSSRCLRARSAATAPLVVGPAGEMEAADALDGDDPPVAQRPRGRLHEVSRAAGRDRRRRRGRAARPTARIPGRRSAGRGSAGRRGPRTPPGSARTS